MKSLLIRNFVKIFKYKNQQTPIDTNSNGDSYEVKGRKPCITEKVNSWTKDNSFE